MSDTNDPFNQQPDPGLPPGSGPPLGGSGPPPPGSEQPPPGYGQPAGYTPPAGGYSQPPGYGSGPAFGQTTAYGVPTPYGLPTPPGYGDVPGQISSEASPILVSFAGPAKQRRVTVFFRLVLAVPHLIVLFALFIGAGVSAFIGWFAALFTGKLPDWAHTFLTQVTRWSARVDAYVFMLTDTYPPFSLDDADYPVRLVSRRTRLNRWAVLFRVILVIPANVVAAILRYGLLALSFFVWLIALVNGGLPPSLYEAVAAIVRYQARYYCYYAMVTADYPGRLYGDITRLESSADAAPSASAPTVGQQPDLAAAADSPASPAPLLAIGAESPASAQPDLSTDAGWRLALSSRAKNIVTVFVIAGVLAYGASAIVNAVNTTNAANNAAGLVQVEQANNTLNKSSQGFEPAMQACGTELTCASVQLTQEAQRLQTFDSQINAIGLTGQAGTDAAALVSDDHAAESDLNQLGAATSASQYLSTLRSGSLQHDLSQAGAAYNKLVSDLGG